MTNLSSSNILRRKNSPAGYILTGLSIALYILLFIRAISTIDTYWDSLAYHLPFAARIVGIFNQNSYTFEPGLEARYLGFPKLIELLQGLLWKATHAVTSTNLVSLFSIFFLNLYASKRLKITFWKITLFFFSIPLVIIHSTTSYIYLPIAAFFGVSFVELIYSLGKGHFDVKSFLISTFFLSACSNSKYQVIPVAIVFYIIMTISYIYLNMRESPVKRNWRIPKFLFLSILLSVSFFILPITNLLKFGNPLYPLNISTPYLSFPGPEIIPPIQNTSGSMSSSLDIFPNIKLFIKSIFELRIFESTTGNLWTVDMYNSYKGFAIRQGGFFFVNITLWFLVVFFSIFSTKNVEYKLISSSPIFLFLFVSVLPYSFELRYWLFLPLILAIVTLYALENLTFPKRFMIDQNFILAFQLLMFLFVLNYTFQFIKPGNDTRNLNLSTYGINMPYYHIEETNSVCMVGFAPTTFLYKLENPNVEIESASIISECKSARIIVNDLTGN